MGLSIRAYARRRGITDTAVHKAVRSGRIQALSDGTIDADQGDAQRERNTSALASEQSNQIAALYRNGIGLIQPKK